MAASFFFYDLETSGISPREARVVQFAGQRTGMDLQPIGEPVNVIIKLTPDVLPDPDAVLVTGITPQQTLAEGITEAEFLKLFTSEITIPGTIFVGYNTVRFDDEFMRFMLYRNFYDAYEWQWKDGRSRWDLLDLVRMTRALRPEGIEWPFTPEGEPTCRLELMTAMNGLDHENAHDALNDVLASIALAKLLKDKQPKLFNFLLDMRDKKRVEELVMGGEPFVYTSGRYPNSCQKTTVAWALARHPLNRSALVYDLRHDPSEFIGLSAEELTERMSYVEDKQSAPTRLPVKTLHFNRCPAVAPLSVLDDASAERIGIDRQAIAKHRQQLVEAPEFTKNLLRAVELLEVKKRAIRPVDEQGVDAQLYDGFFDDHDNQMQQLVRAAAPKEVSGLKPEFHDARLQALLPLYQARNFPDTLSADERQQWDEFCIRRLFAGGQKSRFARYATRLQELMSESDVSEHKRYLLEELRLYGESIMPAETDA